MSGRRYFYVGDDGPFTLEEALVRIEQHGGALSSKPECDLAYEHLRRIAQRALEDVEWDGEPYEFGPRIPTDFEIEAAWAAETQRTQERVTQISTGNVLFDLWLTGVAEQRMRPLDQNWLD